MTDENDEAFRMLMKTEHECAACSDALCLTDEIVVMTVITLVVELDAGMPIAAASIVEAEDGDFLYTPRFLEYECWEDVADELRAALDDTPPIEHSEAVRSCKICESGILLGETAGLVTKGELHCSQRMPDGVVTNTFDAQDPDPEIVCIACLQRLCDEYLILWDSVEQDGECREGTNVRCWRHGCHGESGCLLRIE